MDDRGMTQDGREMSQGCQMDTIGMSMGCQRDAIGLPEGWQRCQMVEEYCRKGRGKAKEWHLKRIKDDKEKQKNSKFNSLSYLRSTKRFSSLMSR